jgi:hypothetical protein
VMDQLEWGDHLVLHLPNKHKFYNPAGLYIHIKEKATPPETFETSRKRSLTEVARQAREKEEQEFAALQLAYMQYQEQQLDRFVEANPDEFSTLSKPRKRGSHRRSIGSGSLRANKIFCRERRSDKSERTW